MKKNRKCKVINKPISDTVKDVEFIEVTEGLTQMSGINDNFFKRNMDIISNNESSKTKTFNFKTITFDEVIPKNNEIDYLSLDIEGGELNLLKSINFDIFTIKVISVENNTPKDQNFKSFFENKNFSYFDRFGQDEIFYNNKFFQLKKMKIFPAIDIKDKKCVRLVKGDFDNKTEYEMSPIEQAEKYRDHGFKNLHIVDLDGALTGETVNLDIIQDIVGKFNLKVEIGGGIRNLGSVQKYVNAGVDKVILGSAAIKDKNFLKDACEKFPNKIALGLDAKDGYLSVSGWKESSNQLTLDYLNEVNDYGVSRLIYTDINRDGMKQSPNFDETAKVAEISNCPVIISGGVSSIDDIKKAKNLKNVEGIIVGKAIYDGDIKLEELVKEDA